MVKLNALLQRDYGKAQDCSLVSILCVLQKDKKMTSLQSVYDIIESIASKYYYNGDKWGTIPFYIKNIMSKTYNALGISRKFSVKYGKGIGFTFNTIKNLIDRDIPMVLSMFSDGVGKYKSHSVVVVGYDNATKELIIYDNWTLEPQRIKYSKLCVISCINWAE